MYVCMWLCVYVRSYILATTEARVMKFGIQIGTKVPYPILGLEVKRSRPGSQGSLSAFFVYCIFVIGRAIPRMAKVGIWDHVWVP